jgi:hypothetical protein
MAINDGIGNPVRDPFPGVELPAGTGLAGTAHPRGPAPDDRPAGEITGPAGTWWDRKSTTTHGTLQPGQLDEGFSGLGADFTADSGAGKGTAGHWSRFDWQQPDGRPTS